MADLLAFIHTVPSRVGFCTSLAQEILPADVEVLHIADEILLKVVLAKGGLTPFIFQRVADHVIACERAGADAVHLTCSSISPCAAPAPTTLQPTTELVRQRAAAAGRTVEVDALLCHGAYEALFAGATETHDRIVREHLRTLMSRNEVVILAQASMARVLETLPTAERRVPILSSPRLAVERLRQVLAGGGGAHGRPPRHGSGEG